MMQWKRDQKRYNHNKPEDEEVRVGKRISYDWDNRFGEVVWLFSICIDLLIKFIWYIQVRENRTKMMRRWFQFIWQCMYY